MEQTKSGYAALIAAFVACIAVPAVLIAIFWVLRDAPPGYDCGESEPAGHDAALDAYRSGRTALHAGAALLLMAVIAWLSVERGKLAGRRPAVGGPTATVLTLLVPYLAGALVEAEVLIPLAFVAVLLVGLPWSVGGDGLALVTVFALVAGLAWLATRRARSGSPLNLALATVAWALLLIGLPLSVVFVEFQGSGPLIC